MGHNNNYRVLMIGDRSDLAASLATQLQSHGYPSVVAATGEEGVQLLNEGSPDLVMIVQTLPHENGLAQCRAIRGASAVPVIVVTGRGAEQHCVDSLEAGADDYVAKPLTPRELVARMEAAIRRSNMQPYRSDKGRGHRESEGVLQVDNVRLDLTTCRVNVNGAVKTLTPNEFRLMAIFMRAPGEVFTREDLRKRVWPDDQHSLHLVEVHIANLRAKIESDPHHPNYIVTVRSRGYKFVTPE
jgi:DNA-binding response OmpR family regulator